MAGGSEDERIGEGVWDGAMREAYLEDEPPPVRPAPRSTSRFDLLGEERNGGRTTVIRARDRELDRDVALEVLAERVEQASEAIGGFLAEAQVVGQLQHPGILPVLGLGFLEDGRPFVARSLAEGETLADLLARGGENRIRLLRLVEQAAQALAYAHARGVVHGTLDPSSVVRGAHGEVVVAGWDRATRTNGDPAPVSRDVEALGAILETVSGHDGSFRSAGEIARTIRRRLDRAERSARTAEVAAAREMARAERDRAIHDLEPRRAQAARRARRRSLAVVAAVLLATTFAGASIIWKRVEDARATERLVREVAAVLREAGRHEAAGRWADARACALEVLARHDSASAASLVDRVQRKEQAARRDARLLSRLGELRALVYSGFPIDPVRLDTSYVEAFVEAGIRVDTEEIDRTVDRLRAVGAPGEIAAGLDDLMCVRRIDWPGSSHRKPWRHLVHIASAVDPDPWRIRLRAETDAETRLEQAAIVDVAAQSPEGLNLLGLILVEQGAFGAAHDLLREACRRSPGRIGLRVALTKDVVVGQSGREAGVPHATAAAALGPGEWATWINLAHGLILGRHGEEAVAVARRALGLRPDHAWSHDTLGAALVLRGDLEEGQARIERALAIAPRLVTARVNRASVLLARGKIEEAEREARRAVELATVEPEPCAVLGRVLARREDLDGAEAMLREAVQKGITQGHVYCELARIRLLRRDPDGAIRLLEKATALDPGHGCAFDRLGEAWWDKGDLPRAAEAWREALRRGAVGFSTFHNLSVTLLRLERFGEAVEPLRQAVALSPDDPHQFLRLGQMLGRCGEHGDEIACLEKAVVHGQDLWYTHATLAHRLANCPDERLRRPREAVRVATRAIELAPGQWRTHTFLGLAWLRAGEPDEALPALRRGMALRGGGDANDWLLLALTLERRGDRREAVAWYRRAVTWMAENETDDEELLRFRAEADEALGEADRETKGRK